MKDRADRLYENVLVLRCQTGDESAFAELVDRYAQRLRYFVRKLLGEADGVEDVLQDVWLIVFRRMVDLREPAAFSTWLYRVARNRAYRALRDRRLLLPLEDEDVAVEDDDDENFAAADAAQIHAGLDELPAAHREVLTLRFLEQMTYEDIAQVTGCKLGTVRSRLYYAKRALRRAIERTFQDERERTSQGVVRS